MIVVVALILLAIFFSIRMLTPQDNWICQKGNWTRHGHSKSPMPTTPCALTTK